MAPLKTPKMKINLTDQELNEWRKKRKTWTEGKCPKCGCTFMARTSRLTSGTIKYCSRSCKYDALRKYPVIEYRGEKFYILGGYYVSRKDYRRLNRIVWEDNYGPIPKGYIVHHKDYDKLNNNISNLELVEWGEHTARHHRKEVSIGAFVCIGCGKAVARKMAEIKAGQNKYCSRSCYHSNKERSYEACA